jgi:hypothetical protein
MSYRDFPSALVRIERLEAEVAELRANEPRRIDWLNVYVFGVVVVALASVVLVGSWVVNAR